MLKSVKRIPQSARLKVFQKELDQAGHPVETKTSSLFNIDPYPESTKPLKIDLRLHQLEDTE